MKTIFEYEDYADYLNDWIISRPKKGRGIKKEISLFLNCHPTHITQVFKKKTHLTLEQAAKLVRYLSLSDLEGGFFLGMVEKARAGNQELRDLIGWKQDKIKKEWTALKRFKPNKFEFSDEDKEVYYGNWFYAATRIILSIPKYQNEHAISEQLKISPKKVREALNFFLEKGFITKEGDNYRANFGKLTSGAGAGSIFQKNHHKNWRAQGLISIDDKKKDDLHLTHLFSIAKKDLPIVREQLINSIQEIAKTVEKSKDEDAGCICLDFFQITN
ncbi:MAG: hypothetical protein DRQ88_08550 [Epsilonproteobacteria bacterium]|nr:MAG: hypothetical protein DRQ89_09980 [Campylobacterota bacterium]RLA65917.1 MAG: hypothetical protein DRQ88_08550 [Campylobacterota bacterium]